MNGQTRQRKGKVTASPRAKAKVKARARKTHPGKGNHNQDQAGSPNEDGQRTLCELNLSVMAKRMMLLRVPVWIEQLMCFAFKSATVFQWIRRNCRVRRRESSDGNEEPAGTHETFDQSTGEVLFAVGCRDETNC